MNNKNPTKNQPIRSGDKIICSCNKVRLSTIEGAIDRGCNTLPKIFSVTTAGIGECGGTCRPLLEKILKSKIVS